MILLADSGSTKTDWVLYGNNAIVTRIKTQGLNPTLQETTEIYSILKEELAGRIDATLPEAIYYYGAGCAYENANLRIRKALEQVFNTRNIEINSDFQVVEIGASDMDVS